MSKKSLILRLFLVASSLAVVAHKPVFAEPGADILGTFRDTSAADAGQWMVKYLGGLNEQDPDTGDFVFNETFEWQKEQSYANGVLDTTGYDQAQTVDGASIWGSDISSWISQRQDGSGENGYYSYVTVINDTSFTGVDSAIAFNALSISFTADDHMHAVIINGVSYDGFEAQDYDHTAWVMGYIDLVILPDDGIPWNVDGNNTIEFIVHNSGYFENVINPTGLSAMIQASYNTSVIPEPPVVLMFAAGLLVLPLARRLRKKE
jgi:hypothetical protein